MRTVLVTTRGYEPMVKYWIKLFKIWEDQVDKVVLVKSGPDKLSFGISHPKVEVMDGLDLGYPYNLIHACKKQEGTLLLMHDDVYVYNPEYVDLCFSLAEQGVVVTPMQCTYSPVDYIKKLLVDTFHYDVSVGDGSFILQFLFIRHDLLKQCDYSLNYYGFRMGQYSPHFGLIKYDMSGDIGFGLLVKLLEHNIPIKRITNYTITNYFDNPDKIWTIKPPYMHFESMSYQLDHFKTPTSDRETNALSIRFSLLSEFMDNCLDAEMINRTKEVQFGYTPYYKAIRSWYV